MRAIASRSLPFVIVPVFGLLVMSLFLLLEQRFTGRLDGVPLDDSWIHYRFADNLRAGHGFSFNPGVPTAGSTAPLWVILLSLAGHGFLIPSKAISILAYLGTGLLVYLLGLQAGLRRPYALLAGLSTLAAGRFAWAAPSGMETTAFSLVALLALWVWGLSPDRRITRPAALLFALACLLRPEGLLLLAVACAAEFLVFHSDRSRRMNFLATTGIATLVLAPFLLFNLISSGHLLPNTFYAKTFSSDCPPVARFYLVTGAVFLLDNPLMTVLGLAGIARGGLTGFSRRAPVLLAAALWCASLVIANGLLAPCVSGYFTRYTTPLIPLVMLFGSLGAQLLSDWMKRWSRWQDRSLVSDGLVLAVLVEGLVLAIIPTTLFWAPYYAQSVSDIRQMHIQIGDWLARNSQPGDVLALNDVGAIGSLSGREVIDLMGLTSPEVLSLIAEESPAVREAKMAEYLHQRQPDYLVIFPNWYPTLAGRLPARPVLQVTLPQRKLFSLRQITVTGGPKMVVYQLDWQPGWR